MKSMSCAVLLLVLASGCSPDEGGSSISDGFLDMDVHDTGDPGCTSAPFCSTDHTQVMSCNPATGAYTVIETCVAPEYCVAGACVATTCPPGASECMSETRTRMCRMDGTGWDEMDCPEGQMCNPDTGMCELVCQIRVFVLLDRSGSMADGTPPKWDQAREALSTLMASEPAAEVEFGFGAFNTDGNCSSADLVVDPIPGATASSVDSFFTSESPNGNTPLVSSLEFFASDTTANLNDPDFHNFILLVSDGMDTCYTDVDTCVMGCFSSPTPLICIAECEAAADAVIVPALRAATSLLYTSLDIRTFVVGFGADASPDELQAIAEEGGTELGTWLAAEDVADLVEAFDTILAEMWECNPIM